MALEENCISAYPTNECTQILPLHQYNFHVLSDCSMSDRHASKMNHPPFGGANPNALSHQILLTIH
jgi:hypothetical protein